MAKYVSRIVDLIYQDRHDRFTKRRVQVLAVKADRVLVYCLERQAPRSLRLDNILAVQPAVMSA